MDDFTYIMSTLIKFHEGVLLCLGAMLILVSMGDTKIIKMWIPCKCNINMKTTLSLYQPNEECSTRSLIYYDKTTCLYTSKCTVRRHVS